MPATGRGGTGAGGARFSTPRLQIRDPDAHIVPAPHHTVRCGQSPPASAAPAGSAATGTISGRLTTSAGAGAANTWIGLYEAEDIRFVDGATTGDDGRYTFEGVAAGAYRLQFAPDHGNGPQQYYRQKSEFWDADPVTVTAGATTTADDVLFSTGTVTGQLRTATGEPAPGMYVTVRDDESGASSGGLTDDGRYRIAALLRPAGAGRRPLTV
ncbi:carboxypeptidase regulatory-like domain-containing protein [Micromonospora sp. WMMD1102]|uniref:carboxypeptidase regulatory-like domain-containing protein n=1 Tax=Micromonospora sp. WMMD1102 TaxID=3016105 RepID=UPI002414F0F9|nr:carboxypeptidase regulatory-like domain-containing protein [Micromonospora sp. WMMD1102]MDG4791786.1 carboxypeptidase regulatory-like domain-containing protein [Micromonospora sp. WMMD1102]